MEKTFYKFGVLYLSWTDKNGNEWTAVKEQVDLFGKECFEQTIEDGEEPISDCLATPTKQDYDYIDSWYEEHPNTSAVPFPEWI